MKLSEAIREGAKLRPQKFGAPHPADDTSCVVIAALEAATGSLRRAKRQYDQERAGRLFPALARPTVRCPSRGCRSHEFEALEGLLYHLNDSHTWTRERIADWVEQFERAGA